MKRKPTSDDDNEVADLAEAAAVAVATQPELVVGEHVINVSPVETTDVTIGEASVVTAAVTLEEDAASIHRHNVGQAITQQQQQHAVSHQLSTDNEQQQQYLKQDPQNLSHHHQAAEHVIENNHQESKRKHARTIGRGSEWNEMLYQLILYKAIHGDLRPKSKDEEYKPLHDWMVVQRREFKVYHEQPERSYLTLEQMKVLDYLQFPWNTRGDEHWFRNYNHLKQFKKDHNHCMVPRTYVDVPNLSQWVTDQRRQLKNLKSGKPSTMTKERQRLLDEISFVWQVRNRATWDTRFSELVEFKERKGTTIVPQHYSANKALGKWVAKQREQYKLLKKGEHSFLTPDRLDQLNSIGFVWSMKGRILKAEEVIVEEEEVSEETDIEDAAVAAARAAVAAAVAVLPPEHHHYNDVHHHQQQYHHHSQHTHEGNMQQHSEHQHTEHHFESHDDSEARIKLKSEPINTLTTVEVTSQE